MTSPRFEELNKRKLKRYFEVNPHMATQFGEHDPYDYHLPNGGEKRLTDTMLILDEWYAEVADIVRTENLSLDERISFEVLKVARDTHRFAIEDYPLWRMHPDALEIPGYLFLCMMYRDYWPFEMRMEAIASRLEELPRYLSEFRARFDGGARPVRLWTESAVLSCRGFPGFLGSLVEYSRGRLTDDASNRLRKAVDGAKTRVAVHLEWLERLSKSAVDDFHMGKERFSKLLKIRGFPYTPDETLQIAQRYLSEMKADKARIVKNMSKEGTPEAAYEIVRADTPKDFDGVMSETHRIVQASKRFVQDHDLATLDSHAALRIIETPEFMLDMNPSAMTDMPAPFENVPTGIIVLTRPQTDEELRGVWNHAMIVNTAVHEAYPGHFHQGVMSNRRPWMHQLLQMLMTTDTMVTAYETQEGWAHYCEWMMYEEGFEHTDSAALIVLDAGIWRAVRVIYDVKLAYGEATTEDMAELLSQEASTPLCAAESDVSSFTRTPGYPLSYLIGRHMVFELRKDLEDRLGPRFDLKKFHDLLALNGNLPFFLAREAVRVGMGFKTDLLQDSANSR